MGVRTYEAGPHDDSSPLPGPGAAPALLVAGTAILLLLANGRPLLGGPEAAGVAGAVLQAVLWPVGLALDLDATGRAIVGKILASLCAGIAAAALSAAVARRHPLGAARLSGIVLAVGTTLAAASQSWSGEAPAAAAVAVALLLLVRASLADDPGLAARAALPLGLAVLLAPSTWALALVLVIGVFARWWRASVRLLAWVAPAAVVAAVGLGPWPPPWPPGGDTGALAFLCSPARGALFFAPVVVVGLVGLAGAVRPRRGRDRGAATGSSIWLPLTAGTAAAAHVAAVAFGGGWGVGPFWGPRLLAPAWPLLLLFLPEGLALLRAAGAALVAVSIAVQALGSLAYDGRWDKLHAADAGLAWDLARSPIPFQIRERVVRPALLDIEGRRLVVREHPLVLDGPTGSLVVFLEHGAIVTGAETTLGDVVLEQGARVIGERLHLRAPGDALFFRVRDAARTRRLELRIQGEGSGLLAVGESTFWTPTRWSEHPVGGAFRLRLPWFYPESGGGDIHVVSRGAVEITSVALVPPGEPEDVIRLD